MVRKVTAYFAFSDVHRAAVREELQTAAGPDAKINVAVVAQALGKKWKALDDAEKDRYKQLAAERTQAAEDAETAAAAAAKAAQASTPAAADDPQRDGSAEPNALAADTPDCAEPDRAPDNTSKPAALPVSIVKRIMMLDDDVSRVSAGGVRATAAATELWLGNMAERALGVAASSKRKTLKFSDIQTVATKDRRLGDMGLQDIYDHEDTFAEARGDGEHGDENGGQRQAKKRRKDVTLGPEARPITSFFTGGPKQAQPSSEVVLQPAVA